MEIMSRRLWIGIALISACSSLDAQWLSNPAPGAPRTPDGKVNMTGPVGRISGKPDLSGVWQVEAEPRAPGGLFGLGESENSRYFRSILADFKPNEQPLTPEGAAIFKKNTAPGVVGLQIACLPDGVPHGDLLPEPFKIMQTPTEMLILYEVETTFRQIYMDGRKLPDPSVVRPTWNGYSVGQWEGDTLVVESNGFNDLSWLDAGGHGHSEDMRVEERFHRRDYGHLDVAVTITDPKTFTQPIKINFVERLLPDTDVFEHYCLEDEKDVAHTRPR